MVHFSKIKNLIESSTPAQIRATAYRLKVGFPVLIDSELDLVPRRLVDIRSTDLLMSLLDEFFGVNAIDPQGDCTIVKKFQLQLRRGVFNCLGLFFEPTKLFGCHYDSGGDWIKSLAEEPAITEKLSDRQKQHISKLGATSERDRAH
ncbi:MAG: gamma-glutamylcyclotransferase [Bdellovibrionaceae bacterium]|nr:gamma-glutamylcyclotransferase [Pseudobdellovibrionaceae bacterium]